jgi:hypothetical protein
LKIFAENFIENFVETTCFPEDVLDKVSEKVSDESPVEQASDQKCELVRCGIRLKGAKRERMSAGMKGESGGKFKTVDAPEPIT